MVTTRLLADFIGQLMHTILIVDDDSPLVATIDNLLQEHMYQTLTAYTAEDGVEKAVLMTNPPSLVLLDVMIPTMGGVQACEQIRKIRPKLPIIFLSALGEVNSVVQGLEAGADDYLVKPYKEAELLARIKAHLRRVEPDEDSDLMSFSDGNFTINLNSREVFVDERLVELTPREFALLLVLAKNAGRVVTTSELIQTAWGVQFRDSTDNIKPYIHYLRKKIERDPVSPQWIVTARGVGYRFVDA